MRVHFWSTLAVGVSSTPPLLRLVRVVEVSLLNTWNRDCPST